MSGQDIVMLVLITQLGYWIIIHTMHKRIKDLEQQSEAHISKRIDKLEKDTNAEALRIDSKVDSLSANTAEALQTINEKFTL